MSINFKSVIRFSHYIDTDNIVIIQEKVPNGGVPEHRYFLHVPYKQRNSGPVATVIMYNPSKAGLRDDHGRILSDFTIYNVLQYLYHHQDRFQAVGVMNLLSSFSSNPAKLLTPSFNQSKNNKTLKECISKVNHERGDKLILAWGAPHKKASAETIALYEKQIRYVKSIIGNLPVFHVEDPYRKSPAPQHGSRWTDYEELQPYKL